MWEAINELSDFVRSGIEEGDEQSGGEEENKEPLNTSSENRSVATTTTEGDGDDGSGGVLNQRGDDEDVDENEGGGDGNGVVDDDDDDDEKSGSGNNDDAGLLYNMGGGDFNDILLFNNSNDDDDEDENEDDLEMTPEMEAARRCELQETFTEPLLIDIDDDDDDSNDSSGSVDVSSDCSSGSNGKTITKRIVMENSIDSGEGSNNDDNEVDAENETEDEESIDEEAIELKEIQTFLDAFDIESHTDEISKLLSTENNDKDAATSAAAVEQDDGEAAVPISEDTTLTPLQHHFQTLVPETVSYVDFWTRYYYRCDPDRIAKEWERQDRIEELRQIQRQRERDEALKEVAEAAEAAIRLGRSAATFFKEGLLRSGAAAGHAVEEALTNVAEEAIVGVGEVVGLAEEAAHSLRVHQSKGRPPFVMGVMGEDDDSYYEEDGEEEIDLEEEDDDEDGEEGRVSDWNTSTEYEEEDDYEDVDDDDSTEDEDEEVNFQDVSLLADNDGLDVVKLRQSLMHAEEERNHMMQMVDQRNEEICRLRSTLVSAQKREQQQRLEQCLLSSGNIESRKLKTEAEWLTHLIAATSATNDGSYEQEASINAMKSILAAERNGLHKMKQFAKSVQSFQATIGELQTKIQAAEKDINNPSNNNSELEKQAHMQEDINQMKENYSKLRKEMEETNQCIVEAQTELRTLQEDQRKIKDEEV